MSQPMSQNAGRSRKAACTIAVSVAATVAVLVAGQTDADAARRRTPRRPELAQVSRVDVPLGIQGLAGAGRNVVVPFRLVDRRRSLADVEVHFGVDRNGDGSISDDEYTWATEDRLDVRNTRRNRFPRLFAATGEGGAANAFVWRSTEDVADARFPTQEYRRTDQGRPIADPAHPGEFQFDPATAGVRFRIRTVRKVQGRTFVGPWTVSEPFELDNDAKPAMTVGSVTPGIDPVTLRSRVDIVWTAIDPDSEDADGDGVFDPGEDRDRDGTFDQEQVGVAFDFHAVLPGEDPASMTQAELEGLTWLPCARHADAGDGDSFRAPPPGAGDPDLRVYGSPAGSTWLFVWDADRNVGTNTGPYILRARSIDAKRQPSEPVYVTDPITLGT